FEAQDIDSKQGKFFRVDPDTGFGISDNPYYDPANPDSVRSKVWATGVRNPWRWSVDRPTGDVYFGEVTDGGPEEINIIRADVTDPDKLNFGWPYFEGDNPTRYGTPPADFVYEGAYVALPHTGGYDAITGGAVYRGTEYPDIYDGRYFFANFGQNVLYTADENGNYQQFGNTGDYGSPVDIQLAPDGSIQYLSLFDGTLYRLSFDPSNSPNLIPNAEASASVTAGAGPLTVNFSSEGSNSPNGGSLSYEWDFDADGQIDSTAANPTYTYQSAGKQVATLTVRDSANSTDTTQVEITVTNSQPTDGNLAFGKPTFQSSTAAGALASRAVDGNTDDRFSRQSVAITAVEDKAFWEIDLGAVYNLSSVQLFIGDRPLSNYYVLVSENEFTGGNLSALLEDNDVWSYSDRGEVVDEENIIINQAGRYLRVQLAETDFIALAEVKILGVPI
ncbi:MAG: PQQ-dependent sugar dehydrogenase, partial [Cyanobacteria bacterium J06632_3]